MWLFSVYFCLGSILTGKVRSWLLPSMNLTSTRLQNLHSKATRTLGCSIYEYPYLLVLPAEPKSCRNMQPRGPMQRDSIRDSLFRHHNVEV